MHLRLHALRPSLGYLHPEHLSCLSRISLLLPLHLGLCPVLLFGPVLVLLSLLLLLLLGFPLLLLSFLLGLFLSLTLLLFIILSCLHRNCSSTFAIWTLIESSICSRRSGDTTRFQSMPKVSLPLLPPMLLEGMVGV